MKLNDFLLERYFAQYEFNTPYLLCSSDCESFTIEEILQLEPGAKEKFLQLHLGYTESPGHSELRQLIAQTYNGGRAEDILVFSGAEEGIFATMNVLLSSGDEVIVQSPCYQSLHEVARGAGASIIDWPMNPDKGWELDLDFLKNSISVNTRLVIVNFPNNPTGFYPSPSFFEELVNICRKNNLYLFVDEVYRGLEYEGIPLLPSGYDSYEKAISLGVMSKSLGLPGLRIGWTATKDKDLFQKLAAFKDYTTICNAAPSEFLSIIALKHADKLLDRNREIVKKNRDLLRAFFSRNSTLLSWNSPKAGAIAFPKWEIKISSGYYQKLAEGPGVLLLPGKYYAYPGPYFRLGFGRKNMPEALAAWEQHLPR